jgi:hypothetical protein
MARIGRKELVMVDMLDYRLHYALMAAEERLARAARRSAPGGSRIHVPPTRRTPGLRQGR